MAAGLGFKTFTTGEVLTAADVNGYLMQGILVFATEAARNSAITSPQEGQFAFTKDTNSLWYYTGSAWVASGATGDIEGVTAGTGISGGGTSGTVTITNSMATEITAKADLIVGTGNAAFDNLPVGANGTVLTADSSVSPTGLKWAAPASGGMTLISTTTLSGATTTINTSSGYNQLVLWVNSHYPTADASMTFRLNADSGNNYSFIRDTFTAPTSLASAAEIISNFGLSDNYKNTNTTNTLIFTINNPDSTTAFKPCNLWQRYLNSGNVQTSVNHRATYLSTSAITSIVLGATGTTWAGGTALLYGVK